MGRKRIRIIRGRRYASAQPILGDNVVGIAAALRETTIRALPSTESKNTLETIFL
jgi:hypothetical protein